MMQDKAHRGPATERSWRRPILIALSVVGGLAGLCLLSGVGGWLYIASERDHRADIAWSYVWHREQCRNEDAETVRSPTADPRFGGVRCLVQVTQLVESEYNVPASEVTAIKRRYFEVIGRVGNTETAEEDCQRVVADADWCRQEVAAVMLARFLYSEDNR